MASRHRKDKDRKPLVVHTREAAGTTVSIIDDNSLFSVEIAENSGKKAVIAPFYSLKSALQTSKKILREVVAREAASTP